MRTCCPVPGSCGANEVMDVNVPWKPKPCIQVVGVAAAFSCVCPCMCVPVWRAWFLPSHLHSGGISAGFSSLGTSWTSLLYLGRSWRHHHGHRPGHGNQWAEVSVSDEAFSFNVTLYSPKFKSVSISGLSLYSPRLLTAQFMTSA